MEQPTHPLVAAASQGCIHEAARLLEEGAVEQVMKNKALRVAARNGHTETVALLLQGGANIHAHQDGALCIAASNGKTETVALLLQRGADIHCWQDMALRVAARNGHTETVALLLQRGADGRALNPAKRQQSSAAVVATERKALSRAMLLASSPAIAFSQALAVLRRCSRQQQ